MSIIWTDDLILFNDFKNNIESTNCSLFIYANILSVLITIIYTYFYRSNIQLQKAPSNFLL